MAAAVSYAEGEVAIFNVRLSDDLAGRFDGWSADHGGRSVALRSLVEHAVRDAKALSALSLQHRIGLSAAAAAARFCGLHHRTDVASWR